MNFMLARHRHPRATSTTLVVARDLASRMGGSRDGHVAYAWRDMTRRLRLGRSTIAEHVRVLRELGLLVWVSHGSRRNVLRDRLGHRYRIGDGYRGTATIYAPCAPPAWDEAMGKVRDGHGYRSRIRGYTAAGRQLAIARARPSVPETTPDPFLYSAPPDVPVPVGGETKTPRTRSTPSSRRQRRAAGTTGVTAREAEAGIAYARMLRLEVWWLQHACVRRLGYAVRPLIQAGYSWQESARELSSWRVPQRPRDVVAYIRAGLRQRAQQGLVMLPSYAVQPRRQAHADDDGLRHAAKPAIWIARFGAAFARYEQQLAGPLRAALNKLASRRRPSDAGPRWTYRLREPEQFFLTSLPPRDPLSPRRPSERTAAAAGVMRQDGVWASLDDHARAAAVFQRLRDRLDAEATSSMATSSTLYAAAGGGGRV
ncbi:hypothetical protein AB0C96_35705 [Streptomyces sp. NPDC048506]|uniref:hypothetical protein n=1 Tax=Streptomyces sp. NPDC048506 TaxID=3155028 RepID=UPI003423DAA0